MEQTTTILRSVDKVATTPSKVENSDSTAMNDIALASFDKLRAYCEKENFQGWDPYDGLNSSLFQRIPLLPKNRLARLVWIQALKKMPLNFRPMLGIKKGHNPKGLALFISGYSVLAGNYIPKNEATEKIDELAGLLLALRTEGFSGSCWGYNFDWESKAFYQAKFTPTIVATTYAANALIDAYLVTNNDLYLREAVSAKEFIIKDLKRTYLANGNFAFSYSPFDQTSVFNASLLGARLLSRIYSITGEIELKQLAEKAIGYGVDFQNADGSWFYSPLPFHQWIDNFHTGFNLECISDYATFTGDSKFNESFDKGMSYYLRTFFDAEGRSKYYNNNLFPIDIHAPSQLIITLSKSRLFRQNQALIDRVLGWTIKHMQSPHGYFYYQKRRFYTNRIAYMRWSQAWIFYGLAHYLQNCNTTKS